MTYRRRIKSDCWHHHPACRWWPEAPTEYVERDKKPTTGEVCDECKSKTRRGEP